MKEASIIWFTIQGILLNTFLSTHYGWKMDGNGENFTHCEWKVNGDKWISFMMMLINIHTNYPKYHPWHERSLMSRTHTIYTFAFYCSMTNWAHSPWHIVNNFYFYFYFWWFVGVTKLYDKRSLREWV